MTFHPIHHPVMDMGSWSLTVRVGGLQMGLWIGLELSYHRMVTERTRVGDGGWWGQGGGGGVMEKSASRIEVEDICLGY